MKKYNEIWDEVSTLMKKWNEKENDSEPVYDKKHLTTEIESHDDKITTNIYGIKAPNRDCFDFYGQNKRSTIMRSII